MYRAQVTPDVASYTAAITACSRGCDLPSALELFEAMRSSDRLPPKKNENNPNFVAEKQPKYTEKEPLHTEHDPKHSKTHQNTPKHGSGRGRGPRGGVRGGAPRADVVAYGAAAAACAKGGDEERALLLLRQMGEDGLEPGGGMFGAVMDACARRGNWEKALELLKVGFIG